MKAKCPNCFGEGCSRCESGFIETKFAEGDWFTEHCINEECGYNNGGSIVPFGTTPQSKTYPCPWCGGQTVWLPYFEAPDSGAWTENIEKFTIKRLEEIVESLRNTNIDLRSLIQQIIEGKTEFTIKEYQLMNLCRVCKKPNPNVFYFGKEHAHKKCLEQIGEYVDPWDIPKDQRL